MSSECRCHEGVFCFYCEIYSPLEERNKEAERILKMFLQAHKERGAILTSVCGDEKAIKETYAYFSNEKQQ